MRVPKTTKMGDWITFNRYHKTFFPTSHIWPWRHFPTTLNSMFKSTSMQIWRILRLMLTLLFGQNAFVEKIMASWIAIIFRKQIHQRFFSLLYRFVLPLCTIILKMVDWDGNFFISRKQFVCSFQWEHVSELAARVWFEFSLFYIWIEFFGIFKKFKVDFKINLAMHSGKS